MTEQLHMMNIDLAMDGMMTLGRRRGIPVRETDTGYLTHVLLCELFGENAPSPFALRERTGRFIKVLGYSSMTADACRIHAETFADPTVFSSCNWSSLVSKPMPSEWDKGRILGFELRACPVVRMGTSSVKHKKGAEVDAFLKECWDIDDPSQPVDREETYRKWLMSNLERQGGAELIQASMRSFLRQRMLRRGHGSNRKAHFVERPDAMFRGLLRVSEGDYFMELLKRGIGRHRSFGYGMLLLRPVK